MTGPGADLLSAAAGPSARKTDFHGFPCLEFVHRGRACKAALPLRSAPGRPWAWRAEFFGHEPQTDIALLGHGFHVVWCDAMGMLGSPPAMEIWDGFYSFLTEAGLSRRMALIAFSRGGLFAFRWAARRPETVSCIYADAPVCDFKSWPGAKEGRVAAANPEEWAAVLRWYGFADDGQALAWKGNPVDDLAPLAAAGIPLLHVVGDADRTVPVSENTAVVEERYRALGGRITVIHKPGVDHHPHSLPDPAPIVSFILEAASGAAPGSP
jgi:pimeloyl-ACP methyl ester carboxylesterase